MSLPASLKQSELRLLTVKDKMVLTGYSTNGSSRPAERTSPLSLLVEQGSPFGWSAFLPGHIF